MGGVRDFGATRGAILGSWTGADVIASPLENIDIFYDSKPPIGGRIVWVQAFVDGREIFVGQLDVLPPYELMGVRIVGAGTPSHLATIIKFLSDKLRAPVGLAGPQWLDQLSDVELLSLSGHIRITPYYSQQTAI
jgi:hypothetical protein